MNKLSVETFTGSISPKTEKIIQCMNNYPEGITPKELGRQTGLNVNTIKSILPKMENVKKVMRGLYKVLNWGDGSATSSPSDLTFWNFHNCILSCPLTHYPGTIISSSYNLKLVNLEFSISLKGRATLRLSSDYPLNVSSICMVAGFFTDQISKHSPDRPSFRDITVSTIEFNRDYSNLRLDGVKCITLDNLTEQFKVYQKKLGMRIEHKTKVKFNVDNVVDMLSNNPNSLDLNVKLATQKEQLDRLTHSTSQHTKLLFKVIDRMNEGMG